MKIEVFDRKNKKILIEKNNIMLTFLYNNILGRIINKILIRKWCSKFNSFFIKSRLSKIKINSFIKNNNINMEEYEKKKYNSFNDFFTRNIKEDYRPMSKRDTDLISPCDAKLLVYNINDNLSINVKNSIYTIDELIKDKDLANNYKNGKCLVFRLSVSDYHHYCYIDDGKLLNCKEINGVLHTVNPIAFKKYKVYCENNRIINELETKNFNKVIYIEVGALNIGKIHNSLKKEFKKGEEKGYFSFGASTVILLFKKDTIVIDNDIIINSNKGIETKILYGESIGKRTITK